MASVFKRGRWVDSKGRKCKAGAPGANYVESRFYTIKLHHGGQIQFVKGYTGKQATEQLASKLELRKARGEQLLYDPYKEHRGLPIVKHVAAWVAELRQVGRGDIYCAQCDSRLNRLISECRWKALADVNVDSFVLWRKTASSNIAHNRKDKSKLARVAMGPRTLNH